MLKKSNPLLCSRKCFPGLFLLCHCVILSDGDNLGSVRRRKHPRRLTFKRITRKEEPKELGMVSIRRSMNSWFDTAQLKKPSLNCPGTLLSDVRVTELPLGNTVRVYFWVKQNSLWSKIHLCGAGFSVNLSVTFNIQVWLLVASLDFTI